MARLNEQKPVNDENVEPVSDEARKGDVLGLSGSDVPKTPDPSAESDPESITQRPESRVSVTSSDLRRRAKN